MTFRSLSDPRLVVWAVQIAGRFRFAGGWQPAGSWVVHRRGAAERIVLDRATFHARYARLSRELENG